MIPRDSDERNFNSRVNRLYRWQEASFPFLSVFFFLSFFLLAFSGGGRHTRMYVACRYAKQGLSNFSTSLSSKRSLVGTTTSDQKGAHGIHDTQRGTLSLGNAHANTRL